MQCRSSLPVCAKRYQHGLCCSDGLEESHFCCRILRQRRQEGQETDYLGSAILPAAFIKAFVQVEVPRGRLTARDPPGGGVLILLSLGLSLWRSLLSPWIAASVFSMLKSLNGDVMAASASSICGPGPGLSWGACTGSRLGS